MAEMEDQMNSQLPPCAEQFIDAVIRKMRYRKKIRADVREELTAHFIDELQHHTTDDTRSTAAQALIADFGDVKILAVLMRRAKKRCRPAWRTAVVRTLQTAAVLLICLTIYTIWFATGQPTITTDYLAILNDRARPKVADPENAWPHYEKAIQLYKPPPARILGITTLERDRAYIPGRFSDLDEDVQSEIREWLEKFRSHLDSIDPQAREFVAQSYARGLAPLIKRPRGNAAIVEDVDLLMVYRLDKAIDSTVETVCNAVRKVTPVGFGNVSIPGFAPDANVPVDAQLLQWSQTLVADGDIDSAKAGLQVALLEYWMADPFAETHLGGRIYQYELELMRQWVTDNESALDEIVRGAGKRYCYTQYTYSEDAEDQWLAYVELPKIRAIVDLGRVGLWRSRLAVEQGQFDAAIDHCLIVAALGSHRLNGGALIEQIVGDAVVRAAYRDLLDITEIAQLDDRQLDGFIERLSRVYADDYPTLNVDFEWLSLMDVIQHVFTDGGPGGGHIIGHRMAGGTSDRDIDFLERSGTLISYTALGMIHAGRDATLDFARRIFDRQREVVKMTPYERHISNAPDSREMLAERSQLRYYLLNVRMPALRRISERFHETRALHQATIATLALHRWRLDHDQYPADLAELLDAGLLKEMPMDPFSDKPLIYARTGDTFKLYSVGHDFEDDGGTVEYDKQGRPDIFTSTNADIVYWPVPKPIPAKQASAQLTEEEMI